MQTTFVGAGDVLDGSTPTTQGTGSPADWGVLGIVAGHLLAAVTLIAAGLARAVRTARARPGLTVDTLGFGLAVAAGAVLWGMGAALAASSVSVIILNAHYGKR